MNKDQIAVYLNSHPEFFNDYPELFRKIKSIDEKELPLEPPGTLNLAERIIKRVHEDKEHLKSQLEWLVEISQANEKIQEHLFEIERMILTSCDLVRLTGQLQEEIRSRFAIPHVMICLVESEDLFLDNGLKERYGEPRDGEIRFIDPETAASWFDGEHRPILRGEVQADSRWFQRPEAGESIRSEALIPIIVREALAGAIVLGSAKPFHFHAGLRTEFLERMAEKLAIAIDNILLMDRLRRQPVIDKQTGLFNRAYLDPVLLREFDLARRKGKSLSCIKLRIDYFENLLDTCGETAGEQILKNIGNILTGNCRACDILIRTDIAEFLALLPEIDRQGAILITKRVRGALAKITHDSVPGFGRPSISMGMATYPDESVKTHRELLKAVTRDLAGDVDSGCQRAV